MEVVQKMEMLVIKLNKIVIMKDQVTRVAQYCTTETNLHAESE